MTPMFDDKSRQMLAGFLQSEKDTRPYWETQQRGMVMPLVKSGYNDSVSYGVPAMLGGSGWGVLHDIMQGRAVMPDEVVHGATDAAGAAFTGSLMAPRPANSVGSGGIRAYHGSPHDFDKFDMSKIGSGEGAQAYGHGLYFAENEGVARVYRDVLGLKSADNGRLTSTPEVAAQRALVGARTHGKTTTDADLKAKALETLRLHEDYYRTSQPTDWHVKKGYTNFGELADVNRAAAELIRNDSVKMPGRMYEVSIKANPDDFLDWDKPLSQQSEAIRKFAETAPRTQMYDGNGNVTPLSDLEGGPFYGALAEALGRPWDPAKPRLNEWLNHPAAANKLREAGIPGIRYLDQGSRGAGEGSRNYVVFDDSLVEILRKYGLAGILAGTGAMTTQGNEN